MNEEQARLQLAEDLINLAEAIRDPDSGRVEELFGNKRELHIESVLGGTTTLIAMKRWTEEEIEAVKKQADDSEEWPDLLLESWEM